MTLFGPYKNGNSFLQGSDIVFEVASPLVTLQKWQLICAGFVEGNGCRF